MLKWFWTIFSLGAPVISSLALAASLWNWQYYYFQGNLSSGIYGFFLTGACQKLNKQREGLLWRSRRLLSTKAEGRGGFTTVSLLDNFATFEFAWVSSYGCAEAHVHIRLAAYWQSPKLAPLEGARNTLKDFFSKATKGVFSVAYRKYYVANLLRTKT